MTLKILSGVGLLTAIAITPVNNLHELLFWKWTSIAGAGFSSVIFLITFTLMFRHYERVLRHHEAAVRRMRWLENLLREHGVEATEPPDDEE